MITSNSLFLCLTDDGFSMVILFSCLYIFLWQTYNEVQHCFLTVGLVYPEDLFMFLLNVSTISGLDSFLSFMDF